MSGRCPACPVPADRPCLGGSGDHPIFCEWAAVGDPIKLRHIAFRSGSGPVSPVPPPPGDRSAGAALADRLDLVRACDYRSDALDECGCTARKHCAMRRGQFRDEPHAVTLSDCLVCVVGKARPDENPAK